MVLLEISSKVGFLIPVERKRTGESYACKIVSQLTTGKNREELESHYVVLGEQVDP